MQSWLMHDSRLVLGAGAGIVTCGHFHIVLSLDSG